MKTMSNGAACSSTSRFEGVHRGPDFDGDPTTRVRCRELVRGEPCDGSIEFAGDHDAVIG